LIELIFSKIPDLPWLGDFVHRVFCAGRFVAAFAITFGWLNACSG